jgi:gas vesicle protein
MANNDDGGNFIAGFLFGGIVGVIVGILLAPKAGSETRAELAGQSEVWRDRAEEIAAKVRERVGPAVEGMRERVSPAVEGMRERDSPVAEAINARIGRRAAAPAVDGGPADEVEAGEAESSSPEKPA